MTGETTANGHEFVHVTTPGYDVSTKMTKESYLPIADHSVEFGASKKGLALFGTIGAVIAGGVVAGASMLLHRNTPVMTASRHSRLGIGLAAIGVAAGGAILAARAWDGVQKWHDKSILDQLALGQVKLTEAAGPLPGATNQDGINDAKELYSRKPGDDRANNDYKFDPADYLPDVRPRAPKEIVIDTWTGKTLLRFSSTWMNFGQGALQVGFNSRSYGDVKQIINRADGSRREVKSNAQPTTEAGNHQHTHLEDMSEFTLYKQNPDGTAGQRVSRHHKVSFLLTETDADVAPLLDPDGRQRRRADSAPSRTVQGFGVGRGDTYGAGLEGQEFDISNLPAGKYILRMNFDPNNRIAEVDERNNAWDTAFTLTADKQLANITAIGTPQLPTAPGVTTRSDAKGGYKYGT
jgi:hypothetical protein